MRDSISYNSADEASAKRIAGYSFVLKLLLTGVSIAGLLALPLLPQTLTSSWASGPNELRDHESPRAFQHGLAQDSTIAELSLPCTPEVSRLVNSNGQAQQRFGRALFVTDNLLLVGDVLDREKGTEAGAVFTFFRNQTGDLWNLGEKLTAPDGKAHDHFGFSLAFSPPYLVVGSPAPDQLPEPGSAYVYQHDPVLGTWSFIQKVVASDAAGRDEFGRAVVIGGDWILASSPRNDRGFGGEGAVYAFRRNSGTGDWQQQQKLQPGDALFGDNFGTSIDIEGNSAVIGSIRANHGGLRGAIYIYELDSSGSTWIQAQVLLPPVDLGSRQFGRTVDIEGDTIVVGEPSAPVAGLVHVFSKASGTWTFEQSLFPPDGAVSDKFGTALALGTDTIAVGAHEHSHLGDKAGAVYVFGLDVISGIWTLSAEILACDATEFDGFGRTTELVSDELYVGALKADHPVTGRQVGAVYCFALSAGLRAYCTAKTTSQGCMPTMLTGGGGLPSISDSRPFVLEGRDHLPNRAGLLLYGFAKTALSFHGGTLCVKSPTRTVASGAAVTAPVHCSGIASVGELSHEFNLRIQNGVDPLLTSGQQVFAQWQQRDPTNTIGGFGDNFSSALRFTIGP